MAVLAVGTDVPEFVVAVGASIQQLQGQATSDIVFGSAVGSAIAQGTIVLGIAGLTAYLPIAPRMIRRDAVILLVVIILLEAIAIDGRVDRLDGLVMILAYAMYLIALLQAERGHKKVALAEPDAGAFRRAPPLAVIGIGLVIVALAAHVVVAQVIEFADRIGVGQGLVAVMLVGLGTSLPELALSMRAALDGEPGLSIGNILGSNIFDLLIPIGFGAVIHPLTVDSLFVSYDVPALFLCSAALLAFLIRRRGLQRGEAIALLVLYSGYASFRLLLA